MSSENYGDIRTKAKKRILTVTIIAFVLMMSFATLFAVGNASSTPSGTYIWGTPVSTPITGLNPLTATNLAGEATGLMYPTSLFYAMSDGNLIPWLATNVTISPNGTVYTFNLVHNATWMNGTTVAGPITANDVAFTFNVLKANSTLDGYGVDPYVKSVTALNNYTVQFVLNSSSVMMLTYLSTQTIIPAAWGAYVNGNLSNIGGYNNLDTPHQLQAGPFILQSASETSLNFVANTHFWMGAPKIANLVVEPFKSTSSMTLSFKSGAIDAEYPAISDYAALKNVTGVVNNIYKEPWSYFLWDNTQVAPYNNTDFRIGLAQAINKTEIMQKAEDGIGGQGSFGGEPWTNTSWWAPGLPYYSYNLTNATASFEAAGLVKIGGFWAYGNNNTTVKIEIVDPPISDWTTAASLITNDLSLAGFEVTESVVPFGPWATDMFEKNLSHATDFLSYFGATPSFSNPWYVLQDLYSPSSFWAKYITHWSNSTVNAIINETATEVTNSTQMLQNLFRAEKIIAAQVPMVLIGDIGNYYVYNEAKIAGFVANEPPDGVYNLIKISIPSSVATPSGAVPAYVYAIIAVVILIVIIVPLAYVFSKKNKAKKEQETAPPPEQEKKT